jgi:tetraprenyl-beta-curcumene synthase
MAFVDDTIEVEADIRKVYDVWMAFEDFPEFMEVVERIDLVADDSLHWVAVVEDDVIEWDADIIEHVPDQSVSWQALDGRETGKVTFEKIGADETKVHYQLDYDPKAWEGEPDTTRHWMRRRVDKDLTAFKTFIEKDRGARVILAARRRNGTPPPTNILTMTPKVFLQVLPQVHEHRRHWTDLARVIPSPELRKQALASIADKTFHCEGGGIYGLLAGDRSREAIRFIVAYQTISDYLDNLCDRSTSLDPDHFRLLHTSMRHALTPGAELDDYYRLGDEQDDGGYLSALVATCQAVLAGLPAYESVGPYLHELGDYYCDLQVYKHVRQEDRVSLLQAWFGQHRKAWPPMAWYEFAASSGSTLGVFCLVAYACREDCTALLAREIRDAYFPWVQGLHILLDYLIDQEEDRRGGDLNFCSFYRNRREMVARLSHFYRQADSSISVLPHRGFHRLVIQGLLGVYCSDKKIHRQKEVRIAARRLILLGGGSGVFFYLVAWLYRRVAAGDPRSAPHARSLEGST